MFGAEEIVCEFYVSNLKSSLTLVLSYPGLAPLTFSFSLSSI